MKLFEGLLNKKTKKRSIGVCIPEHAAEKIERQLEEEAQNEKELRETEAEDEYEIPMLEQHEFGNGRTKFEVEGIFQFHGSLMVKGKVLSGTITKKSKALIGKDKIGIESMQLGTKEVELLQKREEGALHLKKAKGMVLKGGDILEFSNAKN